MTALNQWLVQGRVLYARFDGEVAVDHVMAFNAEMQRWIGEEGVAPVHVILDLFGVDRLPSNIRDLMGKMRVDHPEKSGWTVIVSSSPMTRFIAAVTAQILRQKVHAAHTLHDACLFLVQADTTLPPASAFTPPAGAGV